MARKTHRPDDILWLVTESDLKAVRDTSSDIVTLGEIRYKVSKKSDGKAI